jgi:hypothetical protein
MGMKYKGHVTRTGEFINTYTGMITNSERRGSHGRPRRRRNDHEDHEEEDQTSTVA